MHDSVPSMRYSSVCNVLRLRRTSSLIIESTDSMMSVAAWDDIPA